MTKPWNERPWTWEEIRNLDDAGRKKFLRDYGDRAKAALMIEIDGHRDLSDCYEWFCDDCPMASSRSREFNYDDWKVGQCPDRAKIVYAALIKRDGRMPR